MFDLSFELFLSITVDDDRLIKKHAVEATSAQNDFSKLALENMD